MKGIQYVLLDIEGTICPISFVKDTLFPYALKALPDVLAAKWDDPDFRPYRDAFPKDASASPDALQAHVIDLTRRDVKVAYLKNLQGYLWKEGYESGAYSTPLFPDVVPQLKKWKDGGVQLAIYSSGSIFAQKLLFAHVDVTAPATSQKRTVTEVTNGEDEVEPSELAAKRSRVISSEAAKQGDIAASQVQEGQTNAVPTEPSRPIEDMTALISDWFDTTNAGSKTEASSYSKIVAALEWSPSETIFLSDNVREIDAATMAGLKAILVDRAGNAPISETDRSRIAMVTSLDDASLSASVH